jgi:hypothetical protein
MFAQFKVIEREGEEGREQHLAGLLYLMNYLHCRRS